MKNKLLISLLLILFISCVSVIKAGAVSVGLTVLDSNISVGETFDVEVWVDGEGIGEELLAFGFDVFTSGTYFTYTGYTIESGFDDFSFGLNNVSGDVFPGISDDDVLLATLSFSADSAGTDNLNIFGSDGGFFYGLFYEFSGFDIDASTDITVNAAPIPEPGTLLLLGFGLAGLALSRKKFSFWT